ncbi:MAG: LysR family transcriptional regulator [Alphaproteobacteria bacterium]|nr:LysR family transcriptional regulator [Alphaproteobacteria bacterium]
MDRLTALRSFLAVCDTRSFSEAARRLGLSKSLVSRQISGLEGELGVRLISRTTRRLSLTEAGQAYAERCQRVLADLKEADQAVSNLQIKPTGRLRITAPMSFGTLHLAPALPRFVETYLEIELDLSLSDRIVDVIEEGFDLAVRIGRLAESSLIARKLCPMRRIVCASPDYIRSHGAPSRPEDLARHSCLSHSELAMQEWRFVDEKGHPVQMAVRGPVRVNNGEAMRHLALAGLGIVYLPTFFIGPDLKAKRLIPLLEAHTPQDTALYAVYPHSRHLSPKVRAFVDFMAQTFTSPPYWDEGLDFGAGPG